MTPFGFCIDESLVREATDVVKLLRRHDLTVVTAESCTGGLIAAALSHGPEASDSLHGGFVVYTKAHKSTALGVSRALLDTDGSVNVEVAGELARGALERSPADIALAVTGVLGPDPDEDDNPPGKVVFGVVRRGRPVRVFAEHFSRDDPDQVRRAVVIRALALLREAAEAP